MTICYLLDTTDDMQSKWQMSIIEDEPVDNAELLGLGKFAETIFTFLTSENLISPLAIAINGEWGSGKTSLRRFEKIGEYQKYLHRSIF